MKDLILRIYKDGGVYTLYSDKPTVEDLEKIVEFLIAWINNKKGLEPKK